MARELLIIVYKVQFVFNWILATIVAVNWCYIFKLSLPQYSESVAGWGAYTVIVTFGMPAVKLQLTKTVGSVDVAPLQPQTLGYQLLLLSMTGLAVGTSWSGLVALVFPQSHDPSRHGEIGFAVVLVSTVVFVSFQAINEKILQSITLRGYATNYLTVLITTVLNSTWSTLGYFWNAAWNNFLHKRRKPPSNDYHWHLDVGIPVEAHLAADNNCRERHRFKTIQDLMNGRPKDIDGSNGPGYKGLLVKAVVTTALGVFFLYIIPEPLGADAGRFWKRRMLFAMQMMAIIIPAYAVTDAGYYFGTQVVANASNSEWLGLLTAFLYAVLLTLLIMCIGNMIHWKPASRFRNRLFQWGCWLVSYAWWYSWQELLYQIQGFGLSDLDIAEWLQDVLQAIIAIVFACLTTYFVARNFVTVVEARYSPRVRTLGERNLTEPSDDISSEVLTDSTLRFVAECSGIQLSAEARSDIPS